MTNRNKAANLITEAARESELPTEVAVNAVEALQQAGLLAPERMIPYPRPPKDVHQPAWALRDGADDYSRSWVSVMGRTIWLIHGEGGSYAMTTSQAHDLAAALLSAINHQD
ncbi:hypothetical protein QP324_09000 [Corynebacterium sp. UMB0012]|uniref:hypothetical protein n=1 Tax=Corynebacterium sp. UMB0012 TaxID=3046344 RepID=UPI00254E03C6|nr:hypothetical protein [Corynebacterium sp. UMB0012]MDK7048711.1 hypothetical protein [Corynebacterium sp. UMB0012]